MKPNTQKTQAVSIDERARIEGEAFAQALEKAGNTALRVHLVQHFCEEMRKASRGQICVPAYMVKLYPVFRAVNMRTEQVEEDERLEELKLRKRTSKGGAK